MFSQGLSLICALLDVINNMGGMVTACGSYLWSLLQLLCCENWSTPWLLRIQQLLQKLWVSNIWLYTVTTPPIPGCPLMFHRNWCPKTPDYLKGRFSRGIPGSGVMLLMPSLPVTRTCRKAPFAVLTELHLAITCRGSLHAEPNATGLIKLPIMPIINLPDSSSLLNRQLSGVIHAMEPTGVEAQE